MPKINIKRPNKNHPEWVGSFFIIIISLTILGALIHNDQPQNLTGKIKLPSPSLAPRPEFLSKNESTLQTTEQTIDNSEQTKKPKVKSLAAGNQGPILDILLSPGQESQQMVKNGERASSLIKFNLTAKNDDIVINKLIITGFVSQADGDFKAGQNNGQKLSSIITAPCLVFDGQTICHSFNDNNGQIIFPDLVFNIDKDTTKTVTLAGTIRQADSNLKTTVVFDVAQTNDLTVTPPNTMVNDGDDDLADTFFGPNSDFGRKVIIE